MAISRPHGGGHPLIVYRRSRPAAGFDTALELAGDERLTSPLLPGFAVKVAELFG